MRRIRDLDFSQPSLSFRIFVDKARVFLKVLISPDHFEICWRIHLSRCLDTLHCAEGISLVKSVTFEW